MCSTLRVAALVLLCGITCAGGEDDAADLASVGIHAEFARAWESITAVTGRSKPIGWRLATGRVDLATAGIGLGLADPQERVITIDLDQLRARHASSMAPLSLRDAVFLALVHEASHADLLDLVPSLADVSGSDVAAMLREGHAQALTRRVAARVGMSKEFEAFTLMILRSTAGDRRRNWFVAGRHPDSGPADIYVGGELLFAGLRSSFRAAQSEYALRWPLRIIATAGTLQRCFRLWRPINRVSRRQEVTPDFLRAVPAGNGRPVLERTCGIGELVARLGVCTPTELWYLHNHCSGVRFISYRSPDARVSGYVVRLPEVASARNVAPFVEAALRSLLAEKFPHGSWERRSVMTRWRRGHDFVCVARPAAGEGDGHFLVRKGPWLGLIEVKREGRTRVSSGGPVRELLDELLREDAPSEVFPGEGGSGNTASYCAYAFDEQLLLVGSGTWSGRALWGREALRVSGARHVWFRGAGASDPLPGALRVGWSRVPDLSGDASCDAVMEGSEPLGSDVMCALVPSQLRRYVPEIDLGEWFHRLPGVSEGAGRPVIAWPQRQLILWRGSELLAVRARSDVFREWQVDPVAQVDVEFDGGLGEFVVSAKGRDALTDRVTSVQAVRRSDSRYEFLWVPDAPRLELAISGVGRSVVVPRVIGDWDASSVRVRVMEGEAPRLRGPIDLGESWAAQVSWEGGSTLIHFDDSGRPRGGLLPKRLPVRARLIRLEDGFETWCGEWTRLPPRPDVLELATASSHAHDQR
ncbi:MAG: hypothetical protein H6806_07220 [Planctomycetes bacterium]|nr:hypothetical protein [Planctomycetota bacterium]MCB9829534.1 hypothetical protein [Planctomycetota bacterium]